MKGVPWDQALDTILEVNGLGKKESGKVITVLSLEKLKKAEEEQQKRNVAQGRLKQIAIEAKIVEVTTSFARELGIKWGYGYKDRWGEKDYGVMFGSSASGDLTSLPQGVGLTGSNLAVNFSFYRCFGITRDRVGYGDEQIYTGCPASGNGD